ncbi:MAG: hypothetical protein LBC20_05170 [Planctomycetaceae bacterium]|jgi:hypothetical protein|nr:hypothetical protein [Planctomycetaceae bacterium]
MLKKRYKICLFVFSAVVLSLLIFVGVSYRFIKVRERALPARDAAFTKPLSYEEQEAKRLSDEQQAILAEEYERQEAARNASTPSIP